MSSTWNNNIGFTVFGESHGPAIGVVMDNVPPGESIDLDKIYQFMARRAPKQNKTSTQRKEKDMPQIMSGYFNGKTTGTPLCALIANTDQHSQDYSNLSRLARPGHADYTGALRYRGFNDVRGGGHFSGRLTAPLCFAGAVAGQILEKRGIYVGAHIAEIHGIKDKAFDPKRTIFEHLGDEYGWTIIGKVTILLPVIVRDNGGEWYFFSSSRLADGKTYKGFHIAGEGAYEGKIVGVDATGNEYRPYDFSITKNAFSVMISGLVTMLIVFSLVRFYKRKKFKAPRKGMEGLEMIIEMLYKEVIVSVLGKEAKRYAPYLLTLFFFIFISNMMGLIAVFPGGANVMGNMSITLVLALCTFVVINVSGTKEYWKDIFWPDVPVGLKCPVPLLPIIEIFGVFTKPVALMIRLFANMLGGHLIVLVLISLIFLFSVMGQVVLGVTTVFSVLFAVFMNLIHVLIGFIQAYVFMLLSTIFIGLARVRKVKS